MGHSALKTLSIRIMGHYAECCYAEFRVLFIVMLNVVMLNVVMLNAVMLSVVMLNDVIPSVVMLSVVAPQKLYQVVEMEILRDPSKTILAIIYQ